MKNILAIAILILGATGASFAQSEGFFGYTAGYGPVHLAPDPQATPEGGTPTQLPTKDRKKFTNGFTMSYAYYFQGKKKDAKPNKVGLDMDINVQFDGGRPVSAIWAAGVIFKGRTDKKVQPFVRALTGIGRIGYTEHFDNGVGLHSNAKFGPAYVVGAGFDVQTKERRIKWRFGVDYIVTTMVNRTQQFVRGSTGLVFQ